MAGRAPKKSALKGGSANNVVTVAAKKQPVATTIASPVQPSAAKSPSSRVPAKQTATAATPKAKAMIASPPAKKVAAKKPATAARSSVPPPAVAAPVVDDDFEEGKEEAVDDAEPVDEAAVADDEPAAADDNEQSNDVAVDDFNDDATPADDTAAPVSSSATAAATGEDDVVDAITEHDDGESVNSTATTASAASPPPPPPAKAAPTKKRIRTIITETTTTTTTVVKEAKKPNATDDTSITIGGSPAVGQTAGNGAAAKKATNNQITSVYGRVKKKLTRIEQGEWIPDREAPNEAPPSLGGKWLSDWTRVKVKSNQVVPYNETDGMTTINGAPVLTGTAADRYAHGVDGDMAHMADTSEPVDDPAFPPWALWTSIGADGQHPRAMDSLTTSIMMILHLMASIVAFCVVVWTATYGLWRFVLDPMGDLPLAIWVQRSATDEPSWPEVGMILHHTRVIPSSPYKCLHGPSF